MVVFETLTSFPEVFVEVLPVPWLLKFVEIVLLRVLVLTLVVLLKLVLVLRKEFIGVFVLILVLVLGVIEVGRYLGGR